VANFTPVASLLGGLLIGLAAALLLLANGRIAGISGIVGNLPTARTNDIGWRLAFLPACWPRLCCMPQCPARPRCGSTPLPR